MERRMRLLTGSAALLAGAMTVLSQQAGAAQPAPDKQTAMSSAMQSDLNLTAAQAKARLAAEGKAASAEKQARSDLGASFGGAWFDAKSGKLVVATTSTAKADSVTGADVRQVERSQGQLDEYQSRLNDAKASAPKTVPGWYVDVKTNKVVVQSRGAADAAKAFVKKAGVPASAVTVKQSTEAPRPLDVVGGNAYIIEGSWRCSVGFSVNGGFVSAGHCGSPGDTTTGPSGTFAGSSFPGNDYSYVQVSGEALIGGVNDYAGGIVAVSGSQEASVGSSICRSGSTTGWHCGTIGARNATVNYAEGSVYGLIRTDVCAEPGDSGGSAISGNQAQGMTSGGSGNCSSGGTTYFQPVNEALNAYGLSLITN